MRRYNNKEKVASIVLSFHCSMINQNSTSMGVRPILGYATTTLDYSAFRRPWNDLSWSSVADTRQSSALVTAPAVGAFRSLFFSKESLFRTTGVRPGYGSTGLTRKRFNRGKGRSTDDDRMMLARKNSVSVKYKVE